MTKMTEQEIRDYIDEIYPKVRGFCESIGFTKEQWVTEALDPKPKVKRCENCFLWKCDAIRNLEKSFPFFVKTWYKYGCSNCSKFVLKLHLSGETMNEE